MTQTDFFAPAAAARAPHSDEATGAAWPDALRSLDERGFAVLPNLLSAADCEAAAAWYDEPVRFRSRIVMARHGFGAGEYQYFAYPLPDMVAATRHADRVRAALSGPQSATVLVPSLDEAVLVANAYGAEHLEIQTRDPRAVGARIRNAGAIFLGPYSPVSLGDYCAGSNHVLPTSGGARYASALATTTFLKSVQVVEYTEEALSGTAEAIAALTDAENLPAHGEAVAVRLPRAGS